jgi:hypothetical protein
MYVGQLMNITILNNGIISAYDLKYSVLCIGLYHVTCESGIRHKASLDLSQK